MGLCRGRICIVYAAVTLSHNVKVKKKLYEAQQGWTCVKGMYHFCYIQIPQNKFAIDDILLRTDLVSVL